ncbi:hypothetical protein LJK88_42635 [Paenibacillus sp. P26]|nr:hypothetical protein LJK88_42635 [Paenibacillus sp. P26]
MDLGIDLRCKPEHHDGKRGRQSQPDFMSPFANGGVVPQVPCQRLPEKVLVAFRFSPADLLQGDQLLPHCLCGLPQQMQITVLQLPIVHNPDKTKQFLLAPNPDGDASAEPNLGNRGDADRLVAFDNFLHVTVPPQHPDDLLRDSSADDGCDSGLIRFRVVRAVGDEPMIGVFQRNRTMQCFAYVVDQLFQRLVPAVEGVAPGYHTSCSCSGKLKNVPGISSNQ